MNTTITLWTLAFLSLTVLLMVLPLWPAWSEWRHPSDCDPMALDSVRIDAAQTTALRLPEGAHFESLHAQRIVLGPGMPAPVRQALELQRWQPPATARPWGVTGWHIPHDLNIPAGQLVPCSLVVKGRLTLQAHSRLLGDIKTRGRMHIGTGCQVTGNLFSEEDIELDSGSHVSGVVMAEGRLQLAPDVVIGRPHLPVSVCADVIDVQGPVLIHGSVQARIQGHVHAKQGHPTSIPNETFSSPETTL